MTKRMEFPATKFEALYRSEITDFTRDDGEGLEAITLDGQVTMVSESIFNLGAILVAFGTKLLAAESHAAGHAEAAMLFTSLAAEAYEMVRT